MCAVSAHCGGGVHQFDLLSSIPPGGALSVPHEQDVGACDLVVALLFGLVVTTAVAVQFDGNSTGYGDFSHHGPTTLPVPDVDRATSSDNPSDQLHVEWEQAEERYGLYRPISGETVIVVHRQTTNRWAVTPEGWDEIPVHCNMRPEEILADIAHWYNDIHADWEQVGWWLCRVHASSRLSSLPALAVTNRVLIQEDDFLAVDMRPHGLVALAFGEELVVFSTFFPRWVNLSILRSFLEPMVSHAHFGVALRGLYNGVVIGHRLMRCESGFFLHVRFLSTPFFLSELYHSAPLHVASLHTVTDYPRPDDVRWSVVYIAGGATLISSRVYERVDVHAKVALIRGLHLRYPDLVDVNSDLVGVHWSLSSLEPSVNHAKVHYVLAVIEEDMEESTVVLKVELPPYVDIGAVRVPETLTKRRLILQTGLDLVCGPEGEVCACYHNGYELLGGEEVTAYDGDFFACWLDADPQRATLVLTGGNPGSSTSPWELNTGYTSCSLPFAGSDNRQ